MTAEFDWSSAVKERTTDLVSHGWTEKDARAAAVKQAREYMLVMPAFYASCVTIMLFFFYPVAHGLVWQIPTLVIGIALMAGGIWRLFPVWTAVIGAAAVTSSTMAMAI